MLRTSTRWIYHWESWDVNGSNDTANDDGYKPDDSNDFELINQFVYDMPGALMDDMLKKSKNKEDVSGGFDIFQKLKEEAMKPLHKECGSMTRMAFIIRVLHIKTYTLTIKRTLNILF